MKKLEKLKNFFDLYTHQVANVLNKLDKNKILKSAELIEKTIKNKKTIYVCGNGGSHAIANHYVCDYFKVLSQETKLKVKIKSLCSESSLISAISNDFSYDDVFSYQAEKIKKKGDILIIISSSGNSNNIKKVLSLTNKKGFKTIGICGFKGGYLKNRCSIPIHAQINNYGISEDISHIIMHLVMQYIKINNLLKNKKKPIL